LHEHLGALFFGGGDKEVAVARPAFDAQIVDGKADLRILGVGQGGLRAER